MGLVGGVTYSIRVLYPLFHKGFTELRVLALFRKGYFLPLTLLAYAPIYNLDCSLWGLECPSANGKKNWIALVP